MRAEQAGDAQFLPVSLTRSISFVPAGATLGWAVDPSLQLDPGVWGQISSLVALPDGSILAAGPGLATAEFVPQMEGQVVRLFPDGALRTDLPSWKKAGANHAILATVVQVSLTPKGEAIAVTHTRTGGPFSFGYFSMILRLSEADAAWGFVQAYSQAVAVFPSAAGGLFIGGGNSETIPGTLGSAWFLALGRLGADFQADPRFTLPAEYGPSAGGPSSINHIRPLPDGGALVAGAIMFPFNRGWDYTPNTAVFRLGPDGKTVWRHTLDSPAWLTPAAFVAELPGDRLALFPSREVLDLHTGIRLGTFPIPAEVIARTGTYFQELDGRLILSGTFTNYAGITRRGLAAVSPDGALDLSFDPGQGTTNAFAAIAREADGSLLLGGASGTFDGFTHRGLIRLVRRNPNYTPPTAPVFYLEVAPAIAECAYPGEVHVVRSGLTTQTNRVRVQTLAETATAGADFVALDTKLVFLPGEGSKTLPLTVLGDQLQEGTESFRVLAGFEAGSQVLGATNFPVLIGDVDCGVKFLADAITVAEAAGDSWQLAFPTENPPPGFTTRLRTRALTAEPGRDFIPWDGSPVVRTAALVRPRDNAVADGSRQFVVEAYDATTGEPFPGPPALTVTLTDDDTLAGPYRRIAGALGGITPMRDGWLLWGNFPTADGHQRPGLARFTLDGGFDDSFAPPDSLAGLVSAVAAMPEGGLLVGGRFDLVDGTTTAGVVRLDARGKPVPQFRFRAPADGTNCVAQNEPKAILAEPDGSSFMAGSFPAFFGCDAAPRVLRVSAEGEVIASWPIPGHQITSGFTLTGNGRGHRILQGNAGVFVVGEDGLSVLSEVDLGYGAPLVVLPDGGLVGVAGTTLVRHAPDGTLVAEVRQFSAEGTVWDATWLHTVVLRNDGRILVSGVFQPAPGQPAAPRVFTVALVPAALANDQPAVGEIANELRLTGAVVHPSGALAALNVFDVNRPESQWWRLAELGRPIADLDFDNLVADDAGRLHLALRGQAPAGYTVEVSEDLMTWTEWFRSPEINWGHSFLTPELPADLAGRYFRLRF